MTLRLTRRRALAAAAGLCGLFAGTFASAQSFQLADLMGLWAIKMPMGSSTVYSVYQVTTGPASLTMQWARNDTVNPLPGQGPSQTIPTRYDLTVSDRALSGTVTIGPGTLLNCNFGAGTFPIKSGRISPDGNTITIVENHDTPSVYPSCQWAPSSGDTVLQFERYH